MAGAETAPLLRVEGLNVQFWRRGCWVSVVDDVSFDVARGETVGIVGESGSGKSVTSLALMGLIPSLGGRIAGGTVTLDGRDMFSLSKRAWQSVRGREIAMIFQQPLLSLNPSFRIGTQIADTIRAHQSVAKDEARRRAVELLDQVHIPDAKRRFDDYPYQFSGGQAQRIMIAMALACSPKLLIADEPTTALDATIQLKILDLLTEIQADTGVSMLLISHDLGVIARMAHRVAVMYCGQLVERGGKRDVLRETVNPYTRGLIESIPSSRTRRRRLTSIGGSVPSFDALPQGCRFGPRCTHFDITTCGTTPIELVASTTEAHLTRCARWSELRGKPS